MKDYIQHDPWKIIEQGFHKEDNRISESIFSIGNGKMGQRGNFEEHYSGDSMPGNYVAGVYYPDKTRVGWWKNGYPEYFAKVLNAASWIGLDVHVNGERLDLHTAEILDFRRELDMREGWLKRTFKARLLNGNIVEVEALRFLSIADDECGALRYSVKAVNFSGDIEVKSFLNGDVVNEDSNYDEQFWVEIAKSVEGNAGVIVSETKKTAYQVAIGMKFEIFKNDELQDLDYANEALKMYVSGSSKLDVVEGDQIVVYKYACNVSSRYYAADQLLEKAEEAVNRAHSIGFDNMLEDQAKAWADKWQHSDIVVEGDDAAQQGIRFNIFHLNQTYTGEDARLNIGPKGFTGEKYGGVTYWDTEAYCVPFYLCTAPQEVTRKLLIYRHNQLGRAIENAEKLGFDKGAALYPMVTMNGEECHNEWEITFEEIHRNGAIAYAIFNYIRHTDDKEYLAEYGLEVLMGISRFWAQRVNWSEGLEKYVMLGVTGPNEFDNNVDNNWYTSYIAMWCLKYTEESLAYVKENHPKRYEEIVQNASFDASAEVAKWREIREKMYLGYDEKRNIFIQADGFFNKEQILVKDLDPKHLPLVHHWSWDRILRSNFIKQADVLQGLYMFEEEFDLETLKSNYDFYEPRTVHESSLSPCVHSIIAAKLGDEDRAYEFYLRTSRLDLDDYNSDTKDGLHITSMAGTWMSVVEGFGGKRVVDGQLTLSPMLPKQWKSYSFKVSFKGNTILVKVTDSGVEVTHEEGQGLQIKLYDEEINIKANTSIVVHR